MELNLNNLYQRLLYIKAININKIDDKEPQSFRFTSSNLKTSALENCIVMKEIDGCEINLRNLDENALLSQAVYMWFFYEHSIVLEKYTDGQGERLCVFHEEKGKLVQQRTYKDKYYADIVFNDNKLEINLVKEQKPGVSESRCLHFLSNEPRVGYAIF